MNNINSNFLNQYITSNFTKKQHNLPAFTNVTDEKRAQEYTSSRELHMGDNTSRQEKVITRKDDENTKNQVNPTYRISRVNIDSRYRNIETKNILDDKISYLKPNPLSFTQGSNVVRINHENHGFEVEDKIVIQGVIGEYVSILDGITLIKDSNYVRINHKNHNLNYASDTDIFVKISNVVGNGVQGTLLQNIPINDINTIHKIYFKTNPTDIPTNNYYYIKLDGSADSNYDYTSGSTGLYFLQIAGIPLNELNANYPINVNQLNGYHIITNVIDDKTYEINTTSPANTTIFGGGGTTCWVARVNDFIEGYPSNNFYKISLKKTFYNVTKIKLISTEFPNTEKVIKNYPEVKRNNKLYWQISDDGDKIYEIDISPGNYTINTLKDEMETKIKQIQRPNLIFLNDNIQNKSYYYDTYIIPEVDIKSSTDVFSIKLYQNLIIQKPLTLLNTVQSDGFKRMRVYHPNHKLVVGDSITISGSENTENIPSEVINTTHVIEKVFDKDNYQIRLNKYNELESDVTNGGNAVQIKQQIKFRLLFDRPGTLGKILGFKNVGNSTSITVYTKDMTNNTPYENDDSESTQQSIINLSGDNYILMTSPLFKESYSSGQIDGVFAKLLLASDPGTVMYNQFVQLGEDFSVPINGLSEFEVRFYDPTGELFYFNNIEHSYTLEIYEDLTQ